ncbi:hypothetical protein BGZ72_007087 [Mortierella alpina]|nr:hypothetical protein BGZ72_007087 [Mortierella alpina]
MRRQYTKATACEWETSDGRTRSLEELECLIDEICPFFNTVDSIWCKLYSLNPRSALGSTPEIVNADKAFDSDKDGSFQKPGVSARLPQQQQKKDLSRESVTQMISDEKNPAKRSNRIAAVAEDSRDISRLLQDKRADDLRIRRYKIECDHKEKLEKIQADKKIIK